ncbi:hypothetical protein QBC47DRAFT_406270 [Echria macrotheca]|uniref:Uncharacterized protein n=1 Tax=Echria macrotheca TaxID=438768 RepID=A0AAJ0B6D0_9PEZI|nr:hypothetical protein QBC47DRAFT_406270 [Echria macrotheca]
MAKKESGKKKRSSGYTWVWIWTCCHCGYGGPDMSLHLTEHCCWCQHARCPRCSTQQIKQAGR